MVSIDQDSFDILCNIGAFVNAMAGPIAMSAPIQVIFDLFYFTFKTASKYLFIYRVLSSSFLIDLQYIL